MSRIVKSFEFVDGTRNSRQILYQNQLYNKHLGITWRCIQTKCFSTLSADIDSLTIIKEPDEHNGHGEVLGVRLSVMRAVKRMKDEARYEPDITLKSIYDRNRKKCLEDGRPLVVGDPPLWLIGDIVSCNGGCLLPYSNFRGTLAKIRESVIPILPTTIHDIAFETPECYKYTRTEEDQLFLCVFMLVYLIKVLIVMLKLLE